MNFVINLKGALCSPCGFFRIMSIFLLGRRSFPFQRKRDCSSVMGPFLYHTNTRGFSVANEIFTTSESLSKQCVRRRNTVLARLVASCRATPPLKEQYHVLFLLDCIIPNMERPSMEAGAMAPTLSKMVGKMST